MICPICKKEFIGDIKNPDYPFCGNTCRHIDLYNWFNEEYFFSNSIMTEVEEEPYQYNQEGPDCLECGNYINDKCIYGVQSAGKGFNCLEWSKK